MRVLVTGGAGYVGCVTVQLLLDEGHAVRVFDSLRKGGFGLLPMFANPRLEFRRGDVRDPAAVGEALCGVDAVIHLAAIVGYPACAKDPWLARGANVDGTRNIIAQRHPDQLLIFPSSLSNYGAVTGAVCTEDTEPQPITLYGVTKLEAEKAALAAGNAIVFRPATAFGLSPAMRLDLLFNEFVFAALKDRALKVYQPDYMRAFIHVRDFARALTFALANADRMLGQIYNLGDESLNLTKGELARRIRDRIDFELELSGTGEDPDKRNYTVDFSKLRNAGFHTEVSIEEGIDELVCGLGVIDKPALFANVASV